MSDTRLTELNSLLGSPRESAPVWWPLRFGRQVHLPPIIAGVLTFLVLLAIFVAGGLIPFGPSALADSGTAGVGEALFYAFSLAFLLTLTTVILPAAQRDFDELRPYLSLDDQQADACRRALVRHPRRDLLLASSIGGTFGIIHSWLLDDGLITLLTEFAPAFTLTLVSRVAIWILMFQLGFLLVANSHLFAWLGAQRLQVDLFNPHKLYAFGRTALRPTLFLLGLQAAYPLLVLGQTALQPLSFIGLAASLGLVLWLFFEPLYGVRGQIRHVRGNALAEIDQKLGELWRAQVATGNPYQPDRVDEATRLLDLREHLHNVPIWPLGLASARLIIVYLIIPPLGWGITLLTNIWLQYLAGM